MYSHLLLQTMLQRTTMTLRQDTPLSCTTSEVLGGSLSPHGMGLFALLSGLFRKMLLNVSVLRPTSLP